jgi:hypothetical protein
VHIDEVCHNRNIGRDDELQVDGGKIHGSYQRENNEGAGDEGNQGIGAVVVQNKLILK